MSDSLKDQQISIERLRGQLNYQQWTQDFQAVAQMKGLWRYYTGGAPSVIRPKTLTHEADKHKGEFTHCFQCHVEMNEWRDDQIKMQQAIGLLRYSVDPAIQCDIPVSIADPREARNLIEKSYKPDRESLRQLAAARMGAIHFDQFNDVSTYLSRVNQIWYDIKTAGGRFEAIDVALKVTEELPSEYGKELGVYLVDIQYAKNPNLKELTGKLLVAEMKIKARSERSPGHK